jgi:hypothetical protein
MLQTIKPFDYRNSLSEIERNLTSAMLEVLRSGSLVLGAGNQGL